MLLKYPFFLGLFAKAKFLDTLELVLFEDIVFPFLSKNFTIFYFIVDNLVWKKDLYGIVVHMINTDLNRVTLLVRTRHIHRDIKNNCNGFALLSERHFGNEVRKI